MTPGFQATAIVGAVGGALFAGATAVMEQGVNDRLAPRMLKWAAAGAVASLGSNYVLDMIETQRSQAAAPSIPTIAPVEAAQ